MYDILCQIFVDMDSRLNQADRYMERASVDCNGLLVFKNNG